MATSKVTVQSNTNVLVDPTAAALIAANPLLNGAPNSLSSQTGNFTASTDNNVLYIVTPSSASAVITLPAASGLADGWRINVKNNTDGKDVTIVRAGSDTIDGATTIRVPGRSLCTIMRNGSATFIVFAQTEPPVGTLRWNAGTAVPPGWLNANTATAVSRTTYSGLFALVSTTYGVGDTTTTFGLPDTRARALVGPDASAGRLTTDFSGSGGMQAVTAGGTGGEEAHQITELELPAHQHNVEVLSGSISITPGTAGAQGVSSVDDAINTGATGGDNGHNNVQPTLIIGAVLIKT